MKRISDRLSRMTILATTPFCLLTQLPTQGMCQEMQNPPIENIAAELLSQTQEKDQDDWQDEFSFLAETIEDSEDPVAAARDMLEALVAEVNLQTGKSLTLNEVCQMAKDNLNVFQIPPDKQELCLKTFTLLQTNDSASAQVAKQQQQFPLEKV